MSNRSGSKADDEACFEHLLAVLPELASERTAGAMAEPWRRYHATWHLGRMWRIHSELVAEYPTRSEWSRDIALAIAYHDVVYLPAQGAPANEYASAAAFLQDAAGLGLQPLQSERVSRWIVASADHLGQGADLVDPDTDPVGAWFLDLDLEPIASTDFDLNSILLRQEFVHVGDEAFEAGRLAFLSRLGTQPALFRSAEGRRRGWEDAARANLAASLNPAPAPAALLR